MTIACSRPNKDHRPAQWSGSVSYANRRGADVHVKFWLYQWRRAGSLPAFGFDRSFSPWSSGRDRAGLASYTDRRWLAIPEDRRHRNQRSQRTQRQLDAQHPKKRQKTPHPGRTRTHPLRPMRLPTQRHTAIPQQSLSSIDDKTALL